MTRLRLCSLLALLAAGASPVLAQSDPALASTADAFRDDLRLVTNVVATTALIHDATGAFPTTPFGLLGSAAARQTELRSTPLSELDIHSEADRVVLRYVPLPVAPYVREDEVVEIAIQRGEDGTYTGAYQITRREALDDGGARIPYDEAGRYRVERGFGTACVDLATVRAQLAAGTYAPEPGTLGPEPLAIRVHPPGDAAPVFYEEGR